MPPTLKPGSGDKVAGTARSVLERKGGGVHSIGPDASVYDAIAKMDECKVGALFVLEDSRLVGVISERDYARKVILQDRASKQTRVREVMTTPVIYVETSTPLSECMRIIDHERVRHLPVMESGSLVGVVSIGDVVRTIIAQQADTIEYLSTMITDPYPG
jgi:CBS domain-containing protein